MPKAAVLVREVPGLDTEAQRTIANAFADRQGLTVGRVYSDDGRRPRHGRQSLMHGAGPSFNTLVVATTTALGQTLGEVVALLTVLHERGVQVFIADAGDDAGDRLIAAVPQFAATQEALRREAILRGRVTCPRRSGPPVM